VDARKNKFMKKGYTWNIQNEHEKKTMPAYHVQRSIEIKADIETVRASLCDFKQWPNWSPWLITEPDAKLVFNDQQGHVGAAYGWEGKVIGAGDLSLQKMTETELEMQLSFRKPFKSVAKVVFALVATAEGTQISWNMYGRMPFFLFFMTAKMKAYIGMDYERGLRMLKEYLETGAVASKVEIDGVVEWGVGEYFGLENACALDDIATVMGADFEKLYAGVQQNGYVDSDQTPFSLYHVFDVMKKHTQYTIGLPFNGKGEVPAGFVQGHLPTQKYLKVTHTGRYEHLGNAWSSAAAYARANKLKVRSKPLGVEVYVNDPATTAEEALVTEVLLSIK
jgi:effector-binding domain-containing protein